MATYIDSDEVPDSVQSTGDITAVDMKGFDMCTTHDKPVEFFCEDHKMLACSTCAFVHHRKCKSVPEIANVDKKRQCEGLRSALKAAIIATENDMGNSNDATVRLSADVSQIPEKLNEMRESFMQMFDEFAESVNKESVAYRDRTVANWTQTRKECESRIHDMTESKDVIGEVVNHGTDSEQFIIERSMTESVKKQIKDSTAVSSSLHELNIVCTFDRHYQHFESRLASLLKPVELELKYNVMKSTELEQIASIDLKPTGGDGSEPLYSGLDFLPDGRLVAIDNVNYKCVLYDVNLTLMSSLKLGYKYPECLVAVSDEEVAITSGGNYRLDFLHVSKSHQITLRRTRKVNIQYFSISLMDDENFLVCTIDKKTPVRILQNSGAENRFAIKFPSKKYLVGSSFSTCVCSQNKVVLTDKDSDTVYVYDVKTGRKVVVQDGLIKNPCGLALGPNDHVFVCSEQTRSLVEITLTWRVLASHRVDMFPRYLAKSDL